MAKRTFASQFEIMLDYFEKYPQILSGKVDRIFSKATNVLTGIPPLHIVARAIYLKFQIWVMRSREAQLLLNINKIDKFIRTSSKIPPEKKIIELTGKINDNMMCTRTDPESIMKPDSPCAFLITTNHIKTESNKFRLSGQVGSYWLRCNFTCLLCRHNKQVNIHTDSQSSIEAIKSAEPKSEFVNSIKEKIYSSRLLVSLTWVEAHAGNPGNERVDRQAKLATTIGQYINLPSPYS
ncbi:hypothetical protein AVEN_81439-1 [Araneus ventricosus]|uniref:RNase H type-1 domain-containing protein n=1 Tax=Araneus ventricosus TaxID=182803 RepID=A0A4Y2S7Y7_ARAVE|nr:hypothetical protein AVEN_81439-1 [Araneus ventricosus]